MKNSDQVHELDARDLAMDDVAEQLWWLAHHAEIALAHAETGNRTLTQANFNYVVQRARLAAASLIDAAEHDRAKQGRARQ